MSEMSLIPPFALRNIYRQLTKLQGGYVFTGVCDSVHRGVCMVCGGHVCCKGGHVWLLGGCMVAGGHVWLCGGACVVAGGHAWLGGAWLLGGMCDCQGTCVVAGGHAWLLGACMVARGHAWLMGGMRGCWGVCVVAGGMRRIQQDTVNEQVVCILLECILVSKRISNSVNILLTVTFISCNNVTTKYILKLI